MLLTDVKEFPTVPRTVLVRLRSVPEADCNGLADAISSVSNKSPFSTLNIRSRHPSSSPTPCPVPRQPSVGPSILTPDCGQSSPHTRSQEPSLLPWGSTAWVTPKTTKEQPSDEDSSDSLPSLTSLFDPNSHHWKDEPQRDDDDDVVGSKSCDSWSKKPKVSFSSLFLIQFFVSTDQ